VNCTDYVKTLSPRCDVLNSFRLEGVTKTVKRVQCDEGNLSIKRTGTDVKSTAASRNGRSVTSRAYTTPTRDGLLQVVAHNTSPTNNLSNVEDTISLQCIHANLLPSTRVYRVSPPLGRRALLPKRPVGLCNLFERSRRCKRFAYVHFLEKFLENGKIIGNRFTVA
jgi:hypothetical protein